MTRVPLLYNLFLWGCVQFDEFKVCVFQWREFVPPRGILDLSSTPFIHWLSQNVLLLLSWEKLNIVLIYQCNLFFLCDRCNKTNIHRFQSCRGPQIHLSRYSRALYLTKACGCLFMIRMIIEQNNFIYKLILQN